MDICHSGANDLNYFQASFFPTLNSPVLVLGIPGVYPTIKLKMAAYIVYEYYDTGKIIY